MTLVYRFQDRTTLLERLGNAAVKLIKTLTTRARIQHERRMLATLDDRLLKDIGISRADAEFEASRASRDVPGARLPNTDPDASSRRTEQEPRYASAPSTRSMCTDKA